MVVWFLMLRWTPTEGGESVTARSPSMSESPRTVDRGSAATIRLQERVCLGGRCPPCTSQSVWLPSHGLVSKRGSEPPRRLINASRRRTRHDDAFGGKPGLGPVGRGDHDLAALLLHANEERVPARFQSPQRQGPTRISPEARRPERAERALGPDQADWLVGDGTSLAIDDLQGHRGAGFGDVEGERRGVLVGIDDQLETGGKPDPVPTGLDNVSAGSEPVERETAVGLGGRGHAERTVEDAAARVGRDDAEAGVAAADGASSERDPAFGGAGAGSVTRVDCPGSTSRTAAPVWPGIQTTKVGRSTSPSLRASAAWPVAQGACQASRPAGSLIPELTGRRNPGRADKVPGTNGTSLGASHFC